MSFLSRLVVAIREVFSDSNLSAMVLAFWMGIEVKRETKDVRRMSELDFKTPDTS